ncbi:MAG: hypothetical protein HYT75_02770, partial [Deltaproteobacteria bacterium]|nr:hypothetical protein [Deltaproteobacteria bacterium]
MTIEQLEKVCHSRGSGNLECVNFAGMTDLHENNRPVNAFQLQSPEVRLPEAKQKFFIPGPLGNVALFVMGLAPRGDGGAAGSKEKVNQEWQKFLKSLQKLEVTLGKADKSLTADDVVTLATSSRKPECIREGAYAYKRLSESVESFKNLPLEARVNIARQVYEKGLSLDFQNGQAWEAIGNAARKAGFWDFSQSVFLSGGRAYRKAGDYAGAIRASKALQVGYARDTTTAPAVLRGYEKDALANLINDLEHQIEASAGRERLPYIKERAALLASVGRLDAARSEISGAARKTGNVLTALEKAELRDDFARALIRSEHSGEETYVREINAQYRAAAEL